MVGSELFTRLLTRPVVLAAQGGEVITQVLDLFSRFAMIGGGLWTV